jgi:hypothetical protein
LDNDCDIDILDFRHFLRDFTGPWDGCKR